MIDGVGGRGIMFFDVESGPVLMMERAIENMRRFAGGRAYHLGVEWLALIEDEGVRHGARIDPIFGIDVGPRSGAPACAEILSVGRRGGPVSPETRRRMLDNLRGGDIRRS